jgi:hypothetical protein
MNMPAMPEIKRVKYTYELPPTLARHGVQSVTLVELTPGDEIMATKRCGQDALQLTFQLALACLVAVNGQPVSLADGTADAAWGKMKPQVRQLVMQAYSKLHNPERSEADSFLASMTAEVD